MCGVSVRCMYRTLVEGLMFGTCAAFSACVGRLAFLMRVCFRCFPVLVSGCLCMPHHCVSLQHASSMRLHSDTRERSNQGTAPAATTEAPGKPQRLKGHRAPSRHQRRCHTSNTRHTTPWRLCTALHQALCLQAPWPQMLRRHRERPLCHWKCYFITGDAPVAPETLRFHYTLQGQHQAWSQRGPR